MRPNTLFKSFFMGGYECADQINRHGERVNLLQVTQHDVRVEEDYAALAKMGIFTVREGICWSFVEREPLKYDFSEVLNRMKAAEKYGIQIMWDLIHFGYPDGLFPTHPHFVSRFESLCRAFIQFYKENCTQPLYVIPINEISFLSWLSGEVRGTIPFAVNNGWDIKYHLCKAALHGIRILKAADPSCKIIMVEPLICIHDNGESGSEEVFRTNEYQFEAMDIISGRMCPELGGDESYLEIVGLNYYWNCQWILHGETLPWPDISQQRVPLNQLIHEAYRRYGKPTFLSETGHFGEGRVEWLEEITEQCLIAQERGVDFHGICIYPVTDRPDWDDLSRYSNCGIFDLDEHRNRIPELSYVESLRMQQERVHESLVF